MVKALRVLGRHAMVRWMDERCRQLSTDLADPTPRRYGVPFSNSFRWVWHDVFGVANRAVT